MTHVSRIRIAAILVLWFCLPVSTVLALRPDELLLVVNENVPESRELAEFYTAARLVPPGRIVSLKTTDAEEIPFEAYERDVVPPIRRFLRENKLESQVKCLVTFYGVPLRIAGKVSTEQEKQELQQVRAEILETRRQLTAVIEQVERIAREIDPGFSAHAGTGPDEAGERADLAIRTALLGMTEISDPKRQRETATKLMDLLQQLGGAERVAELLHKSQSLRQLLPGHPAPTTQEVKRAQDELTTLLEQRDDAEARQSLRELASETLGLFGRARMLQAQAEYLDNDGTSAALDSELALLWWGYYSRTKWQVNPLHYRARVSPAAPPLLMTARLDAPQADTVRRIILDSLRAERDGLAGKVVIDSRGISPREPGGKPSGYGMYDQTLRNLADTVRTSTQFPLLLDTRDAVLPPDSASGVAVYAGWYSVRHYIPSSTFVPGAVGFHIASFELQSLRAPGERGWVANLLNNGVAATLGPVAEPYLHAFPPADEFFPLVLEGRLTLAEAYWRTTPMTSWMMALVGDPLYRPFARNPAIVPEALPARLRAGALAIGGAPTAPPATIPATAAVSPPSPSSPPPPPPE